MFKNNLSYAFLLGNTEKKKHLSVKVEGIGIIRQRMRHKPKMNHVPEQGLRLLHEVLFPQFYTKYLLKAYT